MNFSGHMHKKTDESFAENLQTSCLLLEILHLRLSPRKSQAFLFRKPYWFHPKRPLVMKIYNTSIHHVEHIKLLGITIDNNLNWIPHINNGTYIWSCNLTQHALMKLTSIQVIIFFLRISQAFHPSHNNLLRTRQIMYLTT